MNQQQLKSILRYEPDSGLFYVVKSTAPRVKVGSVAGSKNASGYIVINRSRVYMAHRLAWLYMTGEMPPKNMDIDHINGARDDNRWSNLRLATRSQNQQNVGVLKSNKLRIRGVSWHPASNMYRAQIRLNNKTKHLGIFKTMEEARAAYYGARVAVHAFAPQELSQ